MRVFFLPQLMNYAFLWSCLSKGSIFVLVFKVYESQSFFERFNVEA